MELLQLPYGHLIEPLPKRQSCFTRVAAQTLPLWMPRGVRVSKRDPVSVAFPAMPIQTGTSHYCYFRINRNVI